MFLSLANRGFEPQINVMLNHTRPDRQSVMFSATFPPSIETLAKRTLRHKPLEIVVGGRSVVAASVSQVPTLVHVFLEVMLTRTHVSWFSCLPFFFNC